MEFISGLIPLFIIISIIVSIVSKAKQAQSKTPVKRPTQTPGAGSQSRGLSLQEMIRQQIEEQRNAASPTGVPPAPKPEPSPAQKPAFDRTLTSIPKTRYSEGDTLNRSTLEGTPVEMQRHSHNAHPGGSYNEGDALDRYSLEGSLLDYEDKFDLDVAASASRRGKSTAKKKSPSGKSGGVSKLKFDGNGIVSGIIMSEILTRRGGKRAVR